MAIHPTKTKYFKNQTQKIKSKELNLPGPESFKDLKWSPKVELKEGIITDNELTKAKEQAKCGFTLSMENTSNRMAKLLRQEYYFGKFISVEDTLLRIDGVTKESIVNLANTMLLKDKIKMASYGPELKKTAIT